MALGGHLVKENTGTKWPVMPNNSVRASVALDYRGRNWGTIQVDLSSREGAHTEVEFVKPLQLEPFGLVSPGPLPCLSLRYHIAQKIHAMTAPPVEAGIPNERFRKYGRS